MNDNRSRHETSSDRVFPLPRAAERTLVRALELFPVVVVTGARQTGKSTLVQHASALAGRPYLSLDDLDVRDQARRDPAGLLAKGPQLVLDEVQRAPDLLLAVKQAVDRDSPRRTGRFVLTGSANLLLMERVSESLAGRAAYLKLWPLTRSERRGLGSTGIWSELLEAPLAEWEELVRDRSSQRESWQDASGIGGLPVPAHHLDSDDARARWFDAYIETYLERDLQVLARIDNLGDFRRLLRAAALRLGGVLNQAELARDIALSRPTTHRWLNLLETSFQVVRVEPYSVNRTKRLVKSPKLYWSDTGLALHLSGGSATGAHLENLVLTDLNAWRELVSPRPNVLYWRTHTQEEVDFVIEAGDALLPIEVKAAGRPRFADVRHLRTFRAEYGDAVKGGLLLHDGDEVAWVSDGILAAPWWRVL